MPELYQSIEARIQLAILELENVESPNIKAWAREHNLPYQRLLARYKGRSSRSERTPSGRKLDESQEAALCRYIDFLDSIYLPPKRPVIAAAANAILASYHIDDSTKPPTIGGHWLQRFLRRHPEYLSRRQRAMDIERKKCLDKQVAKDWFDSYQETIAQYGITADDIWNFDETGFNIGVGRDQWIITREPKRQISGGFSTNREYATVIEAVSATGSTIAPVVILSAKLLLLRWFEIVGDERIAVTETGYLNNVLALQWIQLFNKLTKDSAKGTHRMLLCDQFGSHLTYEFVKYCEDHNIILFFLPPHSSHLLQPLDVGVFSAYKHWHSEWVYDATVSGYEKITKDDFLSAIAQIRQKTFKPSTIKLGFRLTGLWPINPSLIIDSLVDSARDFSYNTPSPPSSTASQDSSDLSTPKTAERVKRLEERLEDKINRMQQPSHRLIKKLSKAATEFAYLAVELKQSIENSEYLREQRYARENRSRKASKLTGIVHSSQVDRMKRILKRGDDLRALMKLRPYYKREVMPELKRVCKAKGYFIKK
ncbi:hypothetical protein N7486_010669 [Penicillium sp. IBT 16267x]|nr:hypothetical protein N7486_010437 [Penicillium sp. IBT 16267x]KAJ6086388.1 hypothetical protein N7486_010669 [Penicillium sp. IBT 16267x]